MQMAVLLQFLLINNGIEMIDDKFQENYAAGYYTTGVLNIPTPAQ